MASSRRETSGRFRQLIRYHGHIRSSVQQVSTPHPISAQSESESGSTAILSPNPYSPNTSSKSGTDSPLTLPHHHPSPSIQSPTPTCLKNTSSPSPRNPSTSGSSLYSPSTSSFPFGSNSRSSKSGWEELTIRPTSSPVLSSRGSQRWG